MILGLKSGIILIMQLYKIRSGTEKDLLNRHYNIGVGISLGNRWFTPENIVSLIEWSMNHTKDYVIVYVADLIHAINIEVRNGKNSEKAEEKALRMGEDILEQVKKIVDEKFGTDEKSKIFYANWSDLFTPSFRAKVDFLYEKYNSDAEFKRTIIELVEGFTKNENRNFTEEDKEKLGTYIIEELPEVLARTPIKGMTMDAYAYPYDSELPELIERIQKGEIFPEIKNSIIDTEPKVFLEVRE